MKSIENCCCDFYLHVAKLFYSIAYIDGEIREEEVQELDTSLHKEWTDKYQGREEVVQEILKNFRELENSESNADEAFVAFLEYKKNHESLFSIPMRNTLWEVSCAIADKVHKKNKSELILLAHLGKALGVMK